VIVPIWSRMVGGLVFGVIGGIAAGWAYAELTRNIADTRVKDGIVFGFLLFLSVAPVTLLNVVLRANGFAHAHVTITDIIAVVLAVGGGATLGWLRARHWRAALACAAAALLLTFAMGGPVPMGRSVRAVEIFFAVFAAALLGGLVLGLLEPRMRESGGH